MSQKKIKQLRRELRKQGLDPNTEPVYNINGVVVEPKPFRLIKKAIKHGTL